MGWIHQPRDLRSLGSVLRVLCGMAFPSQPEMYAQVLLQQRAHVFRSQQFR